MAMIIPVIIFAILLGGILYSKPWYFAKKEDGKKVIQWKRTIIFSIVITLVLSAVLFVFFPELLMF